MEDPSIFKLALYILIILFAFFQGSYVKSVYTSQKQLNNFSYIKKNSNPQEYNNKIIYISSKNPKYETYFEPDFNISFKTAFIRKVVKQCVLTSVKTDDYELGWKTYKNKDLSSSVFNGYEKYFDFKIGNYTVISKSFKKYFKPTCYILSKRDVDNFVSSFAVVDLKYRGDGYFFIRYFENNKNLYKRISDCTLGDMYVFFETYEFEEVSLFGFLNDSKIYHLNSLKYDFSNIYNEKVLPNEMMSKFIRKEKKKTTYSGIALLVILILLYTYFNQTTFSICTLSFIVTYSIYNYVYYFCNIYLVLIISILLLVVIVLIINFYKDNIDDIFSALL